MNYTKRQTTPRVSLFPVIDPDEARVSAIFRERLRETTEDVTLATLDREIVDLDRRKNSRPEFTSGSLLFAGRLGSNAGTRVERKRKKKKRKREDENKRNENVEPYRTRAPYRETTTFSRVRRVARVCPGMRQREFRRPASLTFAWKTRNWLAPLVQDRDERDSFYDCVKLSAASAMNQPPSPNESMYRAGLYPLLFPFTFARILSPPSRLGTVAAARDARAARRVFPLAVTTAAFSGRDATLSGMIAPL